jgi:hypothetical protein
MHLAKLRCLALAPMLSLLAGCGDGTGPRRLTGEDVGGVYQICSLVFTPEGGLPPAVDILAAATEPSRPRELRVGRTSPEFQLEYTQKGDVLRRELRGSYQTGSRAVTLTFSSSPAELGAVLLPSATNPNRLVLDFQGGSLQVSTPAYEVRKADYERLTGQSYPAVKERFNGILTGRFAASCS